MAKTKKVAAKKSKKSAAKKASPRKKEVYQKVLSEIHRVLRDHDLGHLHVHALTLLPATAEGIAAAVSQCPPGTVPTQICEPMPGGGVHCYTLCVPA